MSYKEGLYREVLRILKPNAPRLDEPYLTPHTKGFNFAMQCNGYVYLDGGWRVNDKVNLPFIEEFKAQQISFFGPGGYSDNWLFFLVDPDGSEYFKNVLGQPSVTAAIRKYREIDQDQAARIAFLFGGVTRYMTSKTPTTENVGKAAEAAEYLARMAMLGGRRSGDAVTSALAMYLISGGEVDEDRTFTGNVYHMASSIEEDPITPHDTRDLGLSQIARLRAFIGKYRGERYQPLPDITEYQTAFSEFPTVGAEFHFPLESPSKYPNFWKRLALLNMSQYQRGSYIQLSRNDRGVIEVRMNPSIYPVTIANWNHIRLLLPEINQAFFTATINKSKKADFNWKSTHDQTTLSSLRTLGMLSYASLFRDAPSLSTSGEINFGNVYLGQTVKIHGGEYHFTGNWGAGQEGQYGQLGIYTGFGDNLPYLAYYLSMALADPNILRFIPKNFFAQIRNLKDALALDPLTRRSIFNTMQSCIEADEKLNKAFIAGTRVIELLNP